MPALHRYFFVVACVCEAFFMCNTALPQTLMVKCTPTPTCQASDSQICIDATTGHVAMGHTTVSKDRQISVTVYNKNPFAFEYKLNLDEKTIADADISGFLKLFMPSTQTGDAQAQANTAKAQASGAKEGLKAMFLTNPSPAETKQKDEVQAKIDAFNNSLNDLGTAISDAFDRFDQFAGKYGGFTASLNESACADLQARANKLYDDAVGTRGDLLDSHNDIITLITNLSESFAAANEGVNKLSADSSSKIEKLASSGTEKQIREELSKDFDALKKAESLKATLDKTKASAIGLECMYLQFAQTQIAGLYSGVISPLEQSTAKYGNFWRTTTIGPYEDPTLVTVTLQQKPVPAAKLLSTVKFQPDSAKACSKELLTPNDFSGVVYGAIPPSGRTTTSSDDKSSSSAQNPAQGSKDGSSKTGSKDSASDGFEPVGKAIVHFGAARFVTTAGVTFGFISNTQYGRISGIPLDQNGKPTSTTATSVVGIKGDGSFQVAPSLFLHTPVCHTFSNEFLYGTFGIGVHSDNKGASPQYFVGLSQSFADQHFFLSGGAYIGQQQKLPNGFFLGQDISSVQGDLPINQNTKVGFGLSISYRFNIGTGK